MSNYSQPRDSPDSPGWWAFEGHIQFKDFLYPRNGMLREVVRVYLGETTKQFFAKQESGIRPAKMLVGKWHKLVMPWDA